MEPSDDNQPYHSHIPNKIWYINVNNFLRKENNILKNDTNMPGHSVACLHTVLSTYSRNLFVLSTI